jgi:putative oxidoreductase
MAHVPPQIAVLLRPTTEPAEHDAERPVRAEERPSRLPGAALVDRAVELNARHAATVLRLALALVFGWFGALKIAGASPVEELIGATLPFIDSALSLPVLGVVEVLLAVALALGRFPRLTLLALIGHLAGTFLTFVTASELMWQGGNPLELTTEGEFVVKNVVFISAALLLIAWHSRRADEPGMS